MSWSQEELVAAAYAVVFVFVLVYVAIIAAKLARLQRETAELVELTRARRATSRDPPVSRICCDGALEAIAASSSDRLRPHPPARGEVVWRGEAAPSRRCAPASVTKRARPGSSPGTNGVTLRGVFITFLSDFGLKDDFVGTCHGVIKRIAPDAQIIDITHGIPPTSILEGALVLANTIGFMPVGVHLAIVDPGVGGRAARLRCATRKAVSTSDPTMACCCPRPVGWGSTRLTSWRIPTTRSSRSRGRFTAAISSPLPRLIWPTVSHSSSSARRSTRKCSSASTFPHLRSTGAGSEPRSSTSTASATSRSNLDRDDVEALGIVSGNPVELELAGKQYYAVMARTFADARPGDVILYEDSYKNMSIAISRGSAARMLHASPGQQIRISIAV